MSEAEESKLKERYNPYARRKELGKPKREEPDPKPNPDPQSKD